MKKFLASLLIVILLIVAVGGIYFILQITWTPKYSGEKEFVVKKGETLKQIAQHLQADGLIKSEINFELYLYLKGWRTAIQAGTYKIPALNSVELAKKLVKGEADNEMVLKFIEGWTLNEIIEELARVQKVECTECMKANFLGLAKVDNFRNRYDFLKDVPSNSLEGFVFPDTYRVYKEAGYEDILTRALDNFDNKLTSALRTEVVAQGKNLYDVLKMASIIEQEVIKEDDRKIVAGILWKRLEANMPLQVDSSLKYVIGKQNRNALTLEELKIDSPYNTYKYRGLPPTPICNPGASAIRAAIYPKGSEYWFYLSDKDGKTIFSKTLDEHNAAIKKYLK